MSSSRRPWYPWYPRDFNQDEKVRCLSDDAELLYRRALDVMWQATALHLPSNCYKLANALARGWQFERFEKAWNEVQTPGFELFKTTEDGDFIYSARLSMEAEKIKELSNRRKEFGKIGGYAKAKQKPSKSQAKATAKRKHMASHTDTDTDNIKKNIKKKNPTQMPTDFCLTDKMIEYAESKNFGGDIPDMFDGFCSHHKAKGSKFVDWYSAWRTWVLNQKKWYPDQFKKQKPETRDPVDIETEMFMNDQKQAGVL